jgi:hypothetical protein
MTGNEVRKNYEMGFLDLCLSPNNIRMIKSRRMRWVEHVACMGIENADKNFGSKFWKEVNIRNTWVNIGQ